MKKLREIYFSNNHFDNLDFMEMVLTVIFPGC